MVIVINVGVHQLILLNFYDFMISYIKPHQKQVVSILAYLAQASHELVPPDCIETIIQAISNNFIWSNCTSEIITCGLNSLREICLRCPLAMPESLLQSLLQDYKSHRDKGPMTAARSLLSLYREFDAKMLKKKDRGKQASMQLKTKRVRQYGEIKVFDDVVGGEFWENELESGDENVEQTDSGDLVDDDEENVVDDEQQDSEFEEEEGDSEFEEEDGEFEQEQDGELEKEQQVEQDQDNIPELVPIETNTSKRTSLGSQDSSLKKKPKLGTQRILTDQDFAKIRELNQQHQLSLATGTTLNSDSDDEVVDSTKITKFTKKKDDKEARLQSIKDGRDGRQYGSKKGKKDNHSSSTNKATI